MSKQSADNGIDRPLKVLSRGQEREIDKHRIRIINPYGTALHEELEEQPCANCGVRGDHAHVLYTHGYPEPTVFCTHKCLRQHAQTAEDQDHD